MFDLLYLFSCWNSTASYVYFGFDGCLFICYDMSSIECSNIKNKHGRLSIGRITLYFGINIQYLLHKKLNNIIGLFWSANGVLCELWLSFFLAEL